MFGEFGVLVNQQAIALTKANAYTAAKIVLGTAAPQSQLVQVATAYANYIVPKVNRAQTVQQILGDIEFATFTSQATTPSGTAAAGEIGKAKESIKSTLGIGEAPLGIPNWLLYTGLAAGVYWYYKKRGMPVAVVPTAVVPKG